MDDVCIYSDVIELAVREAKMTRTVMSQDTLMDMFSVVIVAF